MGEIIGRSTRCLVSTAHSLPSPVAERANMAEKPDSKGSMETMELLGTYGILVAFLLFIYVVYTIIY